MGSGFMAFPDEIRYEQSARMLRNLSEFKLKASLVNMFSASARPGDVLIKTIPAAVQFVSAKTFGLQLYESKNSFPIFLFNLLVHCCILVILYKLSNHILHDNVLSLFSVLTWCLLLNSYIYLRHALPYDLSL